MFPDLVCELFHSHRCQSNHKQVLNNKDHNKDDDKGEAKNAVHLALGISPDYRLFRKSVKGQFSDSVMLVSGSARQIKHSLLFDNHVG